MIYYTYCLNILIGLLLYTRSTYGQVAINMPAVGNYGEETHMNCTEASFNIANGYTWFKDNVKIYDNVNGEASSTGKYSSIHGTGLFTLTISNTALNDAGVYSCDYNFDPQSGTLAIQAKGTVTAELSSSSSGKLEVTFQKIYPSLNSVVITCDSIIENGVFVSDETDGDGFITKKWASGKNFTSVPSDCSVDMTLVTTVTVTFVVKSASTEDKTSDTDAIVGGTVGGVLGLCCLAAAVVGIRHLKKKGRTTTLTFVEGSKVTFSCPFPESVTFPEWRGPPGLTIYTILDDTSETINSKIPAFNRLQYARNKRDLILSNAVVGDSGDYKCSYTGQGDHTFTLKVIRGKGDQASNVVNAGSHRPGRPQPPPPSGANSNHREGSGSVVSGRDVEMQETETSFKRRQLPDIHDKKGRGLSANYNDDDHPLVSINIPTKKPGALESIPDSDRQEVTKKKKKRKKRVETEDNQSD